MTPVLLVPLITPLGADGGIDIPALAGLSHAALAGGAAGIVLFGTLGEGQSFSLDERRAALEGLLAVGIAPDQITLGIGTAAVPEAVALARHGLALGVTRQLLLPPFFFKGVSDEGVYRVTAETLDAVGDPELRVLLYDIPPVTSVTYAPDVVARLQASHGAVIAGIKDSVPDWRHVETNLERFPDLEFFVGNEIFLPRALEMGGAGAISGLGNIAARQMAAIATGRADTGTFERMCALYHAIGRHPVIPTVKALTARQAGIPSLARPRAPLMPVDLGSMPEVVAALDALLGIG